LSLIFPRFRFAKALLCVALTLAFYLPSSAIVVTTIPHNPCPNACNGSINAYASTGTPPYQFSWDGGVTWFTSGLYYGLCPGTYTVIARDALGATDTTTGTVVNTPPIVFTATSTNCSSWSVCDGQISFTVTGGTPPYTYVVTNPSNVTTNYTTNPVTNLCVGTYTVNVSDQNNCAGASSSGIYTVTIAAPGSPDPLTISANPGMPVCPYICNRITASAGGGIPPYQYSFSGSSGPWQISGTSPCYQGGPAQTFSVCVKDANNTITCTTVNANWPAPMTMINSIVTPSPCGTCTGSIQLFAGGPGAYTYTINSWATFQNTNAFLNLCPGTYGNCFVSNGVCVAGPVTITVGQSPLTCTTTRTNTTCSGGCDGTATVITPGNGTYQFSIDGGTTWQSSNVFTGLCANTYTLTTRNVSSPSCITTNTVTITQPAAIVPSTPVVNSPACYGGCTGSITAAATPSGTYQYSMNGGVTWQSSASFSGLCAGNYTLMAKNASNCTGSYSFTITQPAQVVPVSTQTTISCYGSCSGSISTTVTPAGTYTYSIDNGITWFAANTFNGLCAGTYTIKVKNASNCIVAAPSVTITQPPQLLITLDSQTNLTCSNGADGTATVTASGGTGIIVYDWSPGNPAGDGTNSVSGLTAGNWSCTITDGNNCSTTQTVTITQPAPIQITAAVSNLVCYGDSSGSFIATVTPADVYQFSIDNGVTWQASNTFNGLHAGSYTVLAQNGNGCVGSHSFTITQPLEIIPAFVSTDISCNGSCNGMIATTVTPAGSYQYSIDNGITWQASNTFSGLCIGIYSITVQNGNGCMVTDYAYAIAEPPALAIALNSQTDLTCNNSADGAASVTASGGTGIIVYDWSPGNPIGDGTNSVTGLSAGTYICTITDANNCTTTQSVAITQPSPIQLTTTNTAMVCYGACNGFINAAASPAGSYQFSIDNGVTWQASGSFNGICEGAYTVIVQDAAGCTSSSSVSITNYPEVLSAAAITPTHCGLCNGAAAVTASGGASPFTYNWTSVVDPQNLCAGNYTVIVTDANSCTDTLAVFIPPSTTIAIDSVSSVGTPSSQSNGSATVYVSGTAPFSFAWDAAAGNQTTQTASNLLPGNYCVTATDANGCSDTVCVSVSVISGIAVVDAENDLSVFPNPFSDELFISGNGVHHIYLYNATGQLTEDLGNVTLSKASLKLNTQEKLSPGVYFIRAENASGIKIVRLVKE
jgi:hypothetical protein